MLLAWTVPIGFLGLAGVARGPPKSPRQAVLGTLGLLPGSPSTQPEWLKGLVKPPPYSVRKESLLRYRISQCRAEVQKLANEISALEARNQNLAQRPGRPCKTEEEANTARIATLRRDAGVAESKIIQYKLRLGAQKGATREGFFGAAARAAEVLSASEERSAAVLFSALRRQQDPWALLREDVTSVARLGSNFTLAAGYLKLMASGGGSSRLPAHAAAILARSNKLEKYAPGILLAVDGYLDLIEPHLDLILERLDEIEPHLPWVLDNLDELAPHCGTLLDHFDALMCFADEGGRYLDILLPYLPLFVYQFDKLGPHLPLCRPHLDKLLPHLLVIAPHSERFAPYLTVSANADVILFYFGWVLRIRWLANLVMRLPFLPWLADKLARWLPRRPVRGNTAYYECVYDGCDIVEYEADLARRRARLAMEQEQRARVEGTSVLAGAVTDRAMSGDAFRPADPGATATLPSPPPAAAVTPEVSSPPPRRTKPDIASRAQGEGRYGQFLKELRTLRKRW